MRKSAIYIFVAAAVVIGLVSCSKEKLPETESEKVQEKEQEKPQQGLRTLTVSFAAGTKTTLGANDQPVWAEGDKISLNGVVYNVPKEAYGKSSCTITTDITGSINAVYPADAYKAQSPYYKVADEQNGSFGSANICYAQVESAGNTISFENKTAVFEVKVPAHTKELVVTSLGEIDATTGQRGTTVRPINSTGSNDAAKQKITVTVTDSSSPTTCYVSVLVDENKPVLLTNLNFDAVTSETTGARGGVSPSYIKSRGVEDPLDYKVEVNTIYTPVLHEYVTVDGKKWATMNVGATSATDNGDYFAWGETTGHAAATASSNAFVFGTDNAGFAWKNCPYAVGGTYKFRKYVPSSETTYRAESFPGDTKTFLDLKDDAAFWNWGGSWRMPTKEEFAGLAALDDETGWDSDNKGYRLTDTNGNSIFLPAAGEGDGTVLYYAGEVGKYWSSSLNTKEPEHSEYSPDKAFSFKFTEKYYVWTEESYRNVGYSVRALSD